MVNGERYRAMDLADIFSTGLYHTARVTMTQLRGVFREQFISLWAFSIPKVIQVIDIIYRFYVVELPYVVEIFLSSSVPANLTSFINFWIS